MVISHDHYDHLDHRTIVALKDRDVKFVVPLGMGAHLAYWGVPEARIVELDWWERTNFGGRGGMDIVCTPARHASGRMIVDDGATLWAGFAFIGAAHRVYYSGDTGLFPAMREIGARLGPFDLTMIEVGQYGSGWPDWHIGPEQAVRAHGMVRGRVMLPVHWGKFQLAYHAWTEPVERTLAAAAAAGATVITPRPGQSIEPAAPHAFERWWPRAPLEDRRPGPDRVVADELIAPQGLPSPALSASRSGRPLPRGGRGGKSPHSPSARGERSAASPRGARGDRGRASGSEPRPVRSTAGLAKRQPATYRRRRRC